MKKIVILAGLFISQTALADGFVPLGTVISSGITPILGSCLNGQFLYDNAGVIGCTTATFPTTAGAAGTVLRSDGTNWVASTNTFANTAAAGTVFAAASANTLAATATPLLGVAGATVGSIGFANATSGSVTLQPVTGALGSSVLSLPASTTTLAGLGIAQTFTANQTISSSNAAALAVGQNGATNPAFVVDASASSSATGIKVSSKAVAGGVAVDVQSTGADETLTIDSKGYGNLSLNGNASGYVTIGTLTPLNSSMTVVGQQTGTMMLRNASAAAGRYWKLGADASSNFVVYNELNTGMYLPYGGTAWVANSDERIKDIIEPISGGLDKVDQLRAVIGKYKTDAPGTRRSFLIAQDVVKVLPEAVNVLDDRDNTMGVAYADVIPLLVAAIKDLKAQFAAYKAAHP